MMVDSNFVRVTYVRVTLHVEPFQSQSFHLSNTEAIGSHGANPELKAYLLICMDSTVIMDVYSFG